MQVCCELSFERGARGPFHESTENFLGPKENFEIKNSWIVAQFLANKPVNFASLTDSLIVSLSKLLKLWYWMQIRQTRNSFPGLKSYRGTFEKQAPVTRSSKVPVTFRPRRKNLTPNWTSCILAWFLANKPVNFVWFTDSFIVSFSKLFQKTLYLDINMDNLKQLSGPKSYRDFGETYPVTQKSR